MNRSIIKSCSATFGCRPVSEGSVNLRCCLVVVVIVVVLVVVVGDPMVFVVVVVVAVVLTFSVKRPVHTCTRAR